MGSKNRRNRETAQQARRLDEALEETFPASDPVSTVTTADIDRRKREQALREARGVSPSR